MRAKAQWRLKRLRVLLQPPWVMNRQGVCLEWGCVPIFNPYLPIS
jgi:hypothetical protein